MNRTEKRLLARTVQVGLMLTLLVVLTDSVGLLSPLERYLYDFRARRFQFYTPAPTDNLVHIDIDDASLDEIGAFPWPRTYLARVIDELRLAGAKVIGLDIIFPEPQKPRYEPLPDGSYEQIIDDQVFAEAIKRAGNVLVPVSLDLEERGRRPVILDAMIEVISRDLEMDQSQVAAKLRGTRHDSRELEAQVRQHFLAAREQAMFARLWALPAEGASDAAGLAATLAPRAHAAGETTDVIHLLEKTRLRVRSVRRLMDFTMPVPAGIDSPLLAPSEKATIPVLCEAGQFGGAVDVLKDADGIVRSVPLVIEYRGRLMPHMALAAPCAWLGVPMSQVKITRDAVTIPVPNDRPIVIPVRTVKSQSFGRVGMLMDVPWFGAPGEEGWLTMYDPPQYKDSKQHVLVRSIWAISAYDRSIGENARTAIEAIGFFEAILNGEQAAQEFLKSAGSLDPLAVESRAQQTLKDETLRQYLQAYQTMPAAELDDAGRRFISSSRALEDVLKRNAQLRAWQAERRDQLRRQVEGRMALIAWTATGTIDFYPTSLHPTCPGGVIQGVVLNGILTRELWTTSSWWTSVLLTILIGAMTTAIVALLPTAVALIGTILLTGGYLGVNGLLFFDYGNRIVGAAGPLTAATVIWFGVTVARFIYEQRERSRITKRFSSYADPALVKAVIENPDAVRFDGQLKECSVVFTDLAGFTTLSEKLRERTVPLLNEYMSLMLPIIRENRGYWNKFLGDGIMFFYNAPADNARHARDAVVTVLQMQKAMDLFNQRLFTRGLPQVAMRAGIATGMMVVGDAGSTDAKHAASDYTVLGDEVNLGARLESANKAFGSRILMSGRTAELLDSDFLLRPMGKIQVVGKTEGVVTFEALCMQAEASDKHRALASLSAEVVQRFREAAFEACVEAARRMEETCGSSKFTQLYLRLSKEYLISPPENFDGQIVLEAK